LNFSQSTKSGFLFIVVQTVPGSLDKEDAIFKRWNPNLSDDPDRHWTVSWQVFVIALF
jgi:hypothetical protein